MEQFIINPSKILDTIQIGIELSDAFVIGTPVNGTFRIYGAGGASVDVYQVPSGKAAVFAMVYLVDIFDPEDPDWFYGRLKAYNPDNSLRWTMDGLTQSPNTNYLEEYQVFPAGSKLVFEYNCNDANGYMEVSWIGVEIYVGTPA